MRTRVCHGTEESSCHAVIGLMLALLTSAAASATTFHVNGMCGNDAWSGLSDVCASPNGPKKTIQAGLNAATDGDQVIVADGVYTGIGNKNLSFHGDAITLASVGGPDGCIIDCESSGRAMTFTGGGSQLQKVTGFTMTRGKDDFTGGGAVYCDVSSPVFVNCSFRENEGGVGGAVKLRRNSHVKFLNCEFARNVVEGGGGAIIGGSSTDASSVLIIGCRFRDNNGGVAGGAIETCLGIATIVIACEFIGNATTFLGGAAHACMNATYVNCSFSRNTSVHGGAVHVDDMFGPIQNCTFSNNSGSAIDISAGSNQTLQNSILWGNMPSQVTLESHPTHPATLVASHCDIQGGWPGVGNINADPLFVQPGSDDLRLGVGSPCVNAGLTSLLPPDTFDLDGDGNTLEPIPYDLAGNPRLLGSSVDMGAYEGEYDALPPQAVTLDLDPGETAIMVPSGGTFDPLSGTAAVIVNTSTVPDATATITELSAAVHPVAGEFSELADVLNAVTSLSPGQFRNQLFIPFAAADLHGAQPTALNLTAFNPATGNWRLAVEGNVQTSPGHAGPVGDRIVVVSTSATQWGLTAEIGDYGVFWNPTLQKGFVWANVDVPGDFAAGAPLCFADCAPPNGDGVINSIDLAALLSAWGSTGGGVFDINHDLVVSGQDLAWVLARWGSCGGPAAAGAPVSAGGFADSTPPAIWGPVTSAEHRRVDVDQNGTVDGRDLAIVLAHWGECQGCRTDFNGDGIVNKSDLDRITGPGR